MKQFEFRLACPDDATRVEAFNQRMAAAGETYHRLSLEKRFRTMVHSESSPITVEKLVCADGDEIRGGVSIKRMIFRINGSSEEVAFSVYPISEGIINRAFSMIGLMIQKELERRYPLRYGLGARTQLYTGMFTLPVPLHFVVLRAHTFLRNINHLRKKKWLRIILDLVALSRIGTAALLLFRLIQRLRRRYPCVEDVTIERFDHWGDWADEVWKTSQDSYSLIGDRSRAALETLYPEGHEHLIKLRFKVKDTNRSIGWAVITASKFRDDKYFGNMRVGAIVDMLADPDNAYSVVSGAIAAARRAKADLIVVNHCDHRWNDAFKRAGMLPGKTNFFLSLSPKLKEQLNPIEDYGSQFYFTRGDGHGPTRLWMADYDSSETPLDLSKSPGDHKSTNEEELIHIRPLARDADAELPLSFSQERLWFLDQLEPDSGAYNIPMVIRLSGALKVGALEKSLAEIVRRHESLRATFLSVEGGPVTVIAPELTLALPVIGLEDLPANKREAKAQHLAIEQAQQPFDLARGPLVRVTLLRLDDEEHWLAATMHHIVSDGWSVGIFRQELAALYKAFSNGQPPALPELPIQYADFAQWQRQWLQGEILDSQLTYWKARLGDAPPMLELPTDRPRPTMQTFRGAKQSLALPQKLVNALQTLSRQEEATLFMTLLAAFQVLLYRYTGQADISVGSPIAGRNRAEVEGLIGFFVNTLVLRTDLAGNPSFRELLHRVREVALGAYAHQDLPFEKLVAELQPERSLSHSPLFQVMFALQNAPAPAAEMPGLTLRREFIDLGTAKFDLTLFVFAQEEGLRVRLEYNTDLFDAATITRMLGNFQTLLEGIVAHPEQRLSNLPLLTEAERHQLLVAWNATEADYPKDKSLHQLFEAQVERTPDAVAVVFEDERLTYRQLNRRANQLAHFLQGLGVGPEVLVGLFIERSLEMVVGLLGILKAGGAYVPLDPAYPQERLAFMLTDSHAPVLVTQQPLVERLPEHSARVVYLDADWPAIACEGEENPASGLKPADRAYVIYTSGSTGKPKGVQIPHRAAINFLHSMYQHPGLTEPDVMLAVTTLSFDIALLELFLPLSVGASVVLVSREMASDARQLQDKLITSGATVMQATPATWRLLLETGWGGNKRLKILCGGEALPRDLANRLRERCASIWNMYGPTETTVWSTVDRVDAGDGAVSIGRPIANTQVYVLDAELQPVPIGVAGELHIGGEGLARGYLNRPELTAEKFIANPFSEEPGARLYKTGDLARYLPNGNIECLGRLDYQVKIRGFRIELGEIEAVLGRHPAMREAAVVAREDSPNDKRLVAYLVADDPGAPSISELRSFLREKLPDYMVPSAFVFLDSLPLTPNRKVDRKALPAPEQTRPELRAAYVVPRTELERFLVNTWREVLHVDEIGIHDNFFDLGGDSIQGAAFINKVQQELQEFVYVVALFDSPTVAEFAAYLNSRYKGAVSRCFGDDTAAPAKVEAELDHAPTVDATKVAEIRALISSVPSHEEHRGVTAKNPPAVFVLSAPRSGTTLLRVMLAGNPRLFAPPELELLTFNTLEERKAALSGRFNLWSEGTIRAIMDIKGCNADQATRIMADCEDSKLTTKQFYREMQEWIGDKKLVDKSTTYALNIETLKRAESYFDNPVYVYLSRHPYGMVKSFQDVSLDQVFFRYEHPFSTRELAELIWIVCHQNIQEFLEHVPENRQYRLRFEDLVNRPQEILKEMCQLMGLEFHVEMARPYKDKERRMTDGIHSVSTMLGDMKFHQHADIDPTLAESWKESHTEDFLGDITWRIAESLGYERPDDPGRVRKDNNVLSNAQATVSPVSRQGIKGMALKLLNWKARSA